MRDTQMARIATAAVAVLVAATGLLIGAIVWALFFVEKWSRAIGNWRFVLFALFEIVVVVFTVRGLYQLLSLAVSPERDAPAAVSGNRTKKGQ